MRLPKGLITVAAIMGVASCSVGRSDLCSPPPDLATIKPTNEATASTDIIYQERRAAACIHLWAYRLAPSKDDGLTVAKAVVQACEGAVNAHANAQAKQAQDFIEPTRENLEWRNDTFEETYREKSEQMEREAGFRVQTARAGNCRAPK